MVPEDRHNYDARYVLKWSNIIKVDYGVEFHITISKNNQFGERVHKVPLAASPDPRFCPVRALTDLALMYGPKYIVPDNPVFRIPTPSGKFVPLKKSEYVNWFRGRLTSMDLVAADYGVHSSEAILGYCAIPADRRMYLSARVNQNLASD